VVFKDVGLIRWTPGNEFEEVDVIHGHRDLFTDFQAVEGAVCAVLRSPRRPSSVGCGCAWTRTLAGGA
jgi:hypothetical protein